MTTGDIASTDDEPTMATSSRVATPEPIGAEMTESMHKRASQLKESLTRGKGKENASELEIVDMLLQSTSYASQLQAQLHDQAETVALLLRQRQFLLDRQDEERELWKVEREGWDRTAEALLSQVNKATPSFYREHEVNRQMAVMDAENLTMRMKLQDMQTRCASLESELAQLKPILLMQPYALVHSDVPKLRRRKKDGVASGSADLGAEGADEPAPAEDDHHASPERKPKGQYYRQREHLPLFVNSSRKPGASSTTKPRTTMVDARSEHLLLAARKIGKERASMLAAMNYQQPVEAKHATTSAPAPPPASTAKGKGKAEDGGLTFNEYVPRAPTTPKTPQRTSKAPPILSPGFPSPYINASPGFTSMVQPYAYVPGTVPGPGYALYSPSAFTYPGTSHAQSLNSSPSRAVAGPSTSNNQSSSSTAPIGTPNRTQRPVGPARPPPSPSKGASPSTPFDKLYSAAQSVLSPAKALESPAKNSSTRSQTRPMARNVPSPDVDGSPTPKRRRVRGTSTQQAQNELALGRMASALDVLADQAAVIGASPGKSSEDAHNRQASVESNGVHPQEASADIGGTRGVFSATEPLVAQTSYKRDAKKTRARAPRKALEPAAKLSRAPRKGKAAAAATQSSNTRSRIQSPADVGPDQQEDVRTEMSRTRSRSRSVLSGGVGREANRNSTNRPSPAQDDEVRQRWLEKLGR